MSYITDKLKSYIEWLENGNGLDREECLSYLKDALQTEYEVEELKESNKRLKTEQDAAIADMRSLDVRCRLCKHSERNKGYGEPCFKTPIQSEHGKCFEWRGMESKNNG